MYQLKTYSDLFCSPNKAELFQESTNSFSVTSKNGMENGKPSVSSEYKKKTIKNNVALCKRKLNPSIVIVSTVTADKLHCFTTDGNVTGLLINI